MPALEAALGPGVAESLARTASQLRADAECLDDLAFAEGGQLRGDCSDPAGLEARWLLALPAAIRTRVLRDAAIMAGCPHGALTARHVEQVDALVTGWRGQRWIDLPGGVRARRRDGMVWFTSSAPGRGTTWGGIPLDESDLGPELKQVLITAEQLQARDRRARGPDRCRLRRP